MTKATRKTDRKRPSKLDAASRSDEYTPPLQPDNVSLYSGMFEMPKFDADNASKYGPKDDPRRRSIILAWLSAGWSRSRACQEAGVTTRTFDRWKAEDEEFKEAQRAAIEEGTDKLEDAARFRGVEGVAKPIYQGGMLVGYQIEHSDTLLQAMLGGRRPEKFGKQRHEHTGVDGKPIEQITKVEVEFVAAKPRPEDQ